MSKFMERKSMWTAFALALAGSTLRRRRSPRSWSASVLKALRLSVKCMWRERSLSAHGRNPGGRGP